MAPADRINALLRPVPVWPLYPLLLVPALWWLWLGMTGGLGVEPIEALEHKLGTFALQLLLVGLAVTPLRRLTRVSLIRYRRAVGLMAFSYVVMHLTVWLLLDVQQLSRAWADILKRPYITIGMAAFVLLLPLAITSNTWSVRRLGAAWRRLHRLTYAAALLGALHYVMLVKGWQSTPLMYFAVLLALLALRLSLGQWLRNRFQPSP